MTSNKLTKQVDRNGLKHKIIEKCFQWYYKNGQQQEEDYHNSCQVYVVKMTIICCSY